MLKDIELLARIYTCVWSCSGPIKVFWPLIGSQIKDKAYSSRFKQIRHTRTETQKINSLTHSFLVLITKGVDEFITGISLNGTFNSDFCLTFIWCKTPIYVFADFFAAKNGYLFKKIMHNFFYSCMGNFKCNNVGFIGQITFTFSIIQIGPNHSNNYIVFPISSVTKESSHWKYIVVKNIPDGMFTVAQLDEMWEYEYPYMKRPKSLALIYLDPNINQVMLYRLESPQLAGLDIIHIEKYGRVMFVDGCMGIRYLP